jgi:hypothetical protein
MAVMVASLAVTARRTLIVLDRGSVTRRGTRLALVIGAATVGILLWGLALSAGHASYAAGS